MVKADLFKMKKEWFNNISIDLQITKKCNYRCDHCFLTDYSGNMSFDTYKRIIDDEFFEDNHLNRNIYFSGGEIFLNEEIERFFRYLSNKNLSVSFVTNGSLINENTISFLKNLDISVGVSLDGPAEFHNKFRNNNKAFTNVDTCIKCLTKNGIDTGIITSLVRENIKYIDWIAKYSINHKVKTLRYQVVTPRGNACLLKEQNELLNQAEVTKLFKKIIDLSGEHIFNLSISTLGQFKSAVIEHGCKFGLNFGEKCHSNSLPWPKTIAIDYKGDIYPVHHEFSTRWKIGNIEQGLYKVLNEYYSSNKHLEFLDILKDTYENDILLNDDEIIFPDLLFDKRMNDIEKEFYTE